MARLVSLFQNVTEIIASRARHYTDDVVEKGFVLPVDCALAKLILEIVEFKELHAPHFFAVLFHILNLSYYFQSEKWFSAVLPPTNRLSSANCSPSPPPIPRSTGN